jgi:hypothetical protein
MRTITCVLVVVGNQLGPRTDSISVRADTTAIE